MVLPPVPMAVANPASLLLGPLALLPSTGAGPDTHIYGTPTGPEGPEMPPAPHEVLERVLPNPRVVFERLASRGEGMLEPLRQGFDEAPRPRDLIDDYDIVPGPHEVLRRVPSPGDVLSDAPGPLRDVEEVVDRALYRAPGPIGDMHTIRRMVRQGTDDMSMVMGEELPEFTASIRDAARDVNREVVELVDFFIDLAPEALEPVRDMAKGLVGVAEKIVGKGIPFIPGI